MSPSFTVGLRFRRHFFGTSYFQFNGGFTTVCPIGAFRSTVAGIIIAFHMVPCLSSLQPAASILNIVLSIPF